MAWTATDGLQQLPLWPGTEPLLRATFTGKPRGQGSLKMITKKYSKYSDPVVKHRNLIVSGLTQLWGIAPPQNVAVVQLLFVFERPVNQTLPINSKRSVPMLRDTAPTYHVDKPDLDKLVRLVFDALTIAGVLTDDCVVVNLDAAKRWADLGQEVAHTAIGVYAP